MPGRQPSDGRRPDPLWYRTVVAMCYTIPCLVQFGAIVAIVNMPWPASGVIH